MVCDYIFYKKQPEQTYFKFNLLQTTIKAYNV